MVSSVILKVFRWFDVALNARSSPYGARSGGQLLHRHEWSMRSFGRPAGSGRVRLLFTTMNQLTAMALFTELYKWWTHVPPNVDSRGWRMMPVSWLQLEQPGQRGQPGHKGPGRGRD